MQTTPGIEKYPAFRLAPLSSWRIKEFSIKSEYTVEVTFNDGMRGVFNLENLIFGNDSGVFKTLQDYQLFQQAELIYGVITWPGGIDIAPDTLYSLAKNSQEIILL